VRFLKNFWLLFTPPCPVKLFELFDRLSFLAKIKVIKLKIDFIYYYRGLCGNAANSLRDFICYRGPINLNAQTNGRMT
jgi:hypothetical protein